MNTDRTCTILEGVAQAFNRPLFQITCGETLLQLTFFVCSGTPYQQRTRRLTKGSGDLGTNAKELEDALEWHFYLANKWNCILLLDEADVFLSARSPEDFQRNSLVAGKRHTIPCW